MPAVRRLAELEASGNLRSLKTTQAVGSFITYEGREYCNASSNDYLGLTSSPLQQKFFEQMDTNSRFVMSNPSSRLMTGNSIHYDELEESLSMLYQGRAALVLGSGYAVNSGVLPVVAGKGDLILADKLIHASLVDGLKLGEATWKRFRHNDIEHLRQLLAQHREAFQQVWIVSESLFSMDGDIAPLAELVALKKEFDCRLYIDEAHAVGVFGDGAGLVSQMGYLDDCDVLVGTLGKALASVGAFVICSPEIKELLVNGMRPLIFSTALPPINLMWSRFVIEQLRSPLVMAHRQQLFHLIKIAVTQLEAPETTQIIPIHAGENDKSLAMAAQCREAGFWVTPIRYPTVPKGQARLRISLNGSMSDQQLNDLLILCKHIG